MRTWALLALSICFAAGTAFADVSNEVIVGIEGDSTEESTDFDGTDISGALETKNTLFTVRYTHFFSPITEDEAPVDLRRFYQHPSSLSAGLAFFGSSLQDGTTAGSEIDTERTVSMLLLGGEYYFPTNTGLFLNIAAGSGTATTTIGGAAEPDTDLAVTFSDIGLRQYAGRSVAFELRFHAESVESTPSGEPKTTSDTAVTYLGVRGVIADTVGLLFEIGGGEREERAVATTTYDVAAVNAEIAAYAGRQLSFRLGIELETEELTGLPSGFGHENTTARTTLAARYWFNERFGMEVPIYAETTEEKVTVPLLGEATQTVRNSGAGLYAAFRF